MSKQPITEKHMIVGTSRTLCATAVITIVVALLGASLTIPFVYESSSMFYKFGWNKILLRTGKMVGLAAALLILMQLPLAGRLKWLDRIFSLPALYVVHRLIAYVIIALAVVHPVLVFIPDGTLMIPFEIRYWPEWVGAGLLSIIGLQFVLGCWRRIFFKAYEKWLLLHRMIGVVAMVLLTVHILYVSETFEQAGLPRHLVLASALAVVALWCRIRLQGRFERDRIFVVQDIKAAGLNAHRVDLKSTTNSPLGYIPGQFTFISFNSQRISKEPHPFTLSSSPSRPHDIQFTIGGSGDWTRRIPSVSKGDTVRIQGPYGRFSHLLAPAHCDIVMIAGGIGITPMLSMIRFMADTNDPRRALLLWSNKTPQHLFNGQELDANVNKLTAFRWIPIFTREKGDRGYFGRLNQSTLASLIDPYDRDPAFFLCGPPPMLKQLCSDLKKLGHPNRSIHYEAFGF